MAGSGDEYHASFEDGTTVRVRMDPSGRGFQVLEDSSEGEELQECHDEQPESRPRVNGRPDWHTRMENSKEVMRADFARRIRTSKITFTPGPEVLIRPCVTCGMLTTDYCPKRSCAAIRWIPSERWAFAQGTPLCDMCYEDSEMCRYCEGTPSCTPCSWVLVWQGRDHGLGRAEVSCEHLFDHDPWDP